MEFCEGGGDIVSYSDEVFILEVSKGGYLLAAFRCEGIEDGVHILDFGHEVADGLPVLGVVKDFRGPYKGGMIEVLGGIVRGMRYHDLQLSETGR
jgi:hypothetical protein